MERTLVSRLVIARELNVESQTVAKWERQGWFPPPVEWISDRVILYDRAAVDRAVKLRAQQRRRRVLPNRTTA
jgi:hypothetical protein